MLMHCMRTARRLSVAGILRHPWFRTELSPFLISLNADLLDLPTAVRRHPAWRRSKHACYIYKYTHVFPCRSYKTFCTLSVSETQGYFIWDLAVGRMHDVRCQGEEDVRGIIILLALLYITAGHHPCRMA